MKACKHELCVEGAIRNECGQWVTGRQGKEGGIPLPVYPSYILNLFPLQILGLPR